ncbi:outer membrane protein TOM13-domain-containing protein [Pilobolus umbonatus]|nr:outer membrane protein TOM13-domain-containing protein [Pilobolus umbonatus]
MSSKELTWYTHPTLLWAVKSTAINFILPFFNGIMLGFGEIFANELIFKYGWFGFKRASMGIQAITATATTDYRKTLDYELKRRD